MKFGLCPYSKACAGMRTVILNSIVAAGLMASIGLVSSARAQSGGVEPLLNRMERLERDIRTLNHQLSRGASSGAPAAMKSGAVPSTRGVSAAPLSGPAMARIGVRMTTLEEELRTATGQNEELVNSMTQIQNRLDRLVSDIDFRLSALEKNSGAARPSGQAEVPSTVPPPAAVTEVAPGGAQTPFATQPGVLGTVGQKDISRLSAQPQAPVAAVTPTVQSPPSIPSVLPKGTPKQQYGFAFSLMRKAQYAEAELALLEFLQRHGKTPLASNARYWLGETHYVRGNYSKAAAVFFEGYKNDTRGSKAPDTLLKLGMSLSHMKKNNEACATFMQLVRDFPESSNSIRRRVVREKKRSGCP